MRLSYYLKSYGDLTGAADNTLRDLHNSPDVTQPPGSYTAARPLLLHSII